jgi:hypothetical protein
MRIRYFEFLCNIIGEPDRGIVLKHEELLKQLYEIEFYSLVPNDDNREADGKQLREIYLHDRGLHGSISFLEEPCSLLEMLIGLSYRLEFESAQSYWEKSPGEWFWILIDNLGLIEYTNDMYFGRLADKKVKLICETFLRRMYKTNGEGGLFPLKYPKRNQRLVEIWYQMSDYILENYPL